MLVGSLSKHIVRRRGSKLKKLLIEPIAHQEIPCRKRQQSTIARPLNTIRTSPNTITQQPKAMRRAIMKRRPTTPKQRAAITRRPASTPTKRRKRIGTSTGINRRRPSGRRFTATLEPDRRRATLESAGLLYNVACRCDCDSGNPSLNLLCYRILLPRHHYDESLRNLLLI